MVKKNLICVVMMVMSWHLGASTQEEVVHYPITDNLVTPKQVKLFAGIDAQGALNYSFRSCDQHVFEDFVRGVGNNDDKIVKTAAELMAVCKKATQQAPNFQGFLKSETARNFRKINFHIDLPAGSCVPELKEEMEKYGIIKAERSLINIQGEGTVIARPTLQEYQGFVVKFCPDQETLTTNLTRYPFQKTEQLQPGQSITFSLLNYTPHADCIHAGPENIEKSRILMVIDQFQHQADQAPHDA